MNRRKILAMFGLSSLIGVPSGVALERFVLDSDPDEPEYYSKLPLDQHNNSLVLEANKESVEIGETITFTATNTSDSEVVRLGCNFEWALQRQHLTRDEWKHVSWTAGRYHLLCENGQTPPGHTQKEQVTMSVQGLNRVASCVEKLEPATYRLIAYAARPPEWTTFELK